MKFEDFSMGLFVNLLIENMPSWFSAVHPYEKRLRVK